MSKTLAGFAWRGIFASTPTGLKNPSRRGHEEFSLEMKMKKILSAALLCLAAANSQAQFADFDVVNGINDPGTRIFLEINPSDFDGFAYDFTITNLSASGYVTGVYFEENWNRKLKSVGTPSGPATYFAASLNPDVSGWIGPKSSHAVAFDTVEHMVQRGVFRDTRHNIVEQGLAPGQSQTFSFATDTRIISLENLHQALATEGYGVAVQLQGIQGYDRESPSWLLANSMPAGGGQGGGGGSFLRNAAVAPTPSAAGLALVGGLISLGKRRRR